MFGRATIRLGIGPHSSSNMIQARSGITHNVNTDVWAAVRSSVSCYVSAEYLLVCDSKI